MAVRIVFLGRLADLAGSPERELTGPLDWRGLLGEFEEPLRDALTGDRVRVAHNGTILSEKSALAADDGDEIAFLPPVSGG